MRVGAVVLDMDGLMLDTEPLYKAAWQHASAMLGYPLDDHVYVRLMGRRTEDCERELIALFGLDFPLAQFRVRWPELWRQLVRDVGISPKGGLLDFLAFTERKGLPRAVATSSDAEYTHLSLQQAGLQGRFSIIVTGDQISRGKPAPDIYLEAARRLGVDPAACVALEDSDAGVIAARRAAMVPLLIPDLKPPSDEAVSAAYRVLRSLDEAQQLLATFIESGDSTGVQ